MEYAIPNHLDEPPRFFLLTLDELFVCGVPLFLGMFVLDSLFLSVLVSIGLFFVLKRWKGSHSQSYVLAMLYWHLPQILPVHATPASFKRVYVP